MKAKPLLVAWHNKEPVFSVDFHSSGIFATAGADSTIWKLQDLMPEYVCDLTGHQKAVNCVRFSPNDCLLASGSDDGRVLIWQQKKDTSGWSCVSILRGHDSDIFDLAWCPSSRYIASASIDNDFRIWDISGKGTTIYRHTHNHYVQGVAWDPFNQYVLSMSSDRSCRVHQNNNTDNKGKKKKDQFSCVQKISWWEQLKSEQPSTSVPSNSASDVPFTADIKNPSEPRVRMFLDENFPSFFRRCAWAIDGSCFIAPAAQIPQNQKEKGAMENVSLIFSRKQLTIPTACLPCGAHPSVAIRFSPIVYRPIPKENVSKDAGGLFNLQYRMVYAIATTDEVLIYSTHSNTPIAMTKDMHFAAITDLAWSRDGNVLIVSSFDAFCSVIAFDDKELGEPIPLEELPPHLVPRQQEDTTPLFAVAEITSEERDDTGHSGEERQMIGMVVLCDDGDDGDANMKTESAEIDMKLEANQSTNIEPKSLNTTKHPEPSSLPVAEDVTQAVIIPFTPLRPPTSDDTMDCLLDTSTSSCQTQPPPLIEIVVHPSTTTPQESHLPPILLPSGPAPSASSTAPTKRRIVPTLVKPST